MLDVQGGSAGTPFSCGSGVSLPLGTLTQDAVTPEQIPLYLPITGAMSSRASAIVRYKRASDSVWQTAHPLLKLDDAFAGTIFDLVPGTSYDVEVQIYDPTAGSQTISRTLTTRALPAASGAATATATPGSNLQTMVNSLGPGDVLELASGTHVLSSDLNIGVSGTPANPIYIRGANRDTTIIDATSGAEINVTGNHVVIEDFTFDGQGGDNGKRVIVLGPPSVVVSYITIRGIKSNGTGKGVQTAGGSTGTNAHNCLVYNCEFLGTNPWNAEFISTNLSWNDDGVRLVGTGNCVWNCTLQGFGDSITFAHSTDDASIIACYAYRNLIRNSCDDCFEFDYTVRNCAAYDNYCENIRPLMSMDPVRGGPVYCFRNIAVNIATRPFKMNTSGDGYIIYNNTMLRSETYQTGDATDDQVAGLGRGWGKLNATRVNRIAYRNNILIYTEGLSPPAEAIYRLRDVAGNRSDPNETIDWTNNAHYPDIAIQWPDGAGTYANLADAQANIGTTLPLFPAEAGLGAPTRRHIDDVICDINPFVSGIVLGSDASYEVTGQVVPVLKSGASPKNAGFAIPNITDGFSGTAPDIGAVISGRTLPAWGAPF